MVVVVVVPGELVVVVIVDVVGPFVVVGSFVVVDVKPFVVVVANKRLRLCDFDVDSPTNFKLFISSFLRLFNLRLFSCSSMLVILTSSSGTV